MPNAALTQYLNKIRKNLICSEEEKRKILKVFENSINDYLAEHPDAKEADLIHRFGEPLEIAQSFLQEEDFQKIQDKAFVKKRIMRVAIPVLIVLIIVAAILIAFNVIDVYLFNNGYYDTNSIPEPPIHR